VAPAARLGAQAIAQQQLQQPQQPQQPVQSGGPPVGGMPSPYGAQPAWLQQGTGVPGATEWSVGTKTQGAPSAGISTGGAQGLEARCAQLQHDVESLALFARTLLTMLEAKNVVTRAEFEQTKRELDMLDGKLDDR
jgi:hypothetical protein